MRLLFEENAPRQLKRDLTEYERMEWKTQWRIVKVNDNILFSFIRLRSTATHINKIKNRLVFKFTKHF